MATNGVKREDQINGESKKNGFFDSVQAPPEWLTESYMENALREYEKDDDLKITRYAIATCTKPGDNFVGVIFRATISFTTRGSARDESFIVKIEPFLEGFKKDAMASQPFFQTEGRMYTELLPVMQELLKNSGDPEMIAPGLIHYNTDPKILIFQDLAPENFVMQHMPVGFEKASIVAKKLGKFHALAWYLDDQQQTGDNVLKSFKDGFFSEKLMKNWDFIITNMNALCELTQEWGMNLVAAKLKALQPHFIEKLMKVYVANPNGLSILNHGDFHIRNLLFRYDQQDPSTYDAIYCIDFQLSVYATPAIDLTYLLYMVSDNDARDNRDELLKTYHDQFTATLKSLGHLGAIPSLSDFHVELQRNGIVEFFIAINFLALFYMDKEKMAVTDFSDKDAMLQMTKDMFEGPVFKPLLQRVLPQFMYKGFLDV